jgi:hypothetical protein
MENIERARLEDFAARELWRWRDELLRRAEQWYPTDIFPPPAKGEPYRTIDAAAAAMARHVLELVASDLADRSIEWTHDEVHEATP